MCSGSFTHYVLTDSVETNFSVKILKKELTK